VGKGDIPRIVWVIYCTTHFVCYHKKHKTKNKTKHNTKTNKKQKKLNYKYTTKNNNIKKQGTTRTNNTQ